MNLEYIIRAMYQIPFALLLFVLAKFWYDIEKDGCLLIHSERTNHILVAVLLILGIIEIAVSITYLVLGVLP